MKKGVVFNIQKFCIHDGDGIRTCVFLKGCPMRCIWCHNPESLEKTLSLSFDKTKCSSCGKCLSVCEGRSIEKGKLYIDREKCVKCGKCSEICLNDANEIIGREMTAEEVFEEVIKDKMFYDSSGGGITVTGGEPSFQPEFTLALLRLSKNAGISLCIETCGMGSEVFYKEAAELGAVFLYDIKCIDSARHRELTGCDNARIMSNLRYLTDRGADVILRLPMIPDCNDSDEDIALLSSFLKENEGRYRYAEIMPYHNLGTGKSEKLGSESVYSRANATEEEILRLRSLFASHGVDIKVSE